MARQINAADRPNDKLVKLIPTEIVTAYVGIAALLGFGVGDAAKALVENHDLANILIQVSFAALLIITPLYARMQNGVRDRGQLVVITLAFVVWVYSLGGPFVVWDIHHPIVGSVLLAFWTLVMPLFWREPKAAGALGNV